MPRGIAEGTRGQYKVFEMSQRGVSGIPSQDGNNESVKKSESSRVNRTSVLLGAISVVVSITFLVLASVYYFQLQGEWKRNSDRLTNEIEGLKHSTSNGFIESNEALQNMVIDVKGSKAINASIEALKRRYIDRATEISKIKAKIRELLVLLNYSKVHDTEILTLKKENIYHSKALLKESEERKNADNSQAGMFKSELHRHEKAHLNQSRIFEERINEVQENESNQSRSMWESINRLRSTYLSFSGKVTDDIFDLRKNNENHLSTLETEKQERKSGDANISLALANEVDKLHRVDDELLDNIRALREADINQSIALTSSEETLRKLNQRNYDALSDQIMELNRSFEIELGGVSNILEDLKEAESNQKLQWEINLEELKSAEMNKSKSLISRLQQLQESASDSYDVLTNKIDERERTDLRLERRIEEVISLLQANQTDLLTELTNMRSRVDQQESQIAVFQSMQANLNKLTLRISLLTAGWKADSLILLYKKFNEKVSYQTAASRCQNVGTGAGRLAAKIFRDSNTVRDMIDTGYITTTRVWVGLDDLKQEGHWRWSDGGTTNSATTSWLEGEPNNSGHSEDCGEVEAEASNGVIRLNDADCSLKQGYVCEIVLQ